MATFAEQFDSLGFVPGAVRGARTFRVNNAGELVGIFYPQVWGVGVNEATCMKDQHRASYNPVALTYYAHSPVSVPPEPPEPAEPEPPHDMEECRHGFYGYYDGSNDYRSHYMVDNCAEAVIEGWGEVMIGTRGFRCMKARIVALCVTRVRLAGQAGYEQMMRKYASVPMFDTFEAMVSAFPPDLGES